MEVLLPKPGTVNNSACSVCVRAQWIDPGESLDCFSEPYDEQLRLISRIVAFRGEARSENRVG